MTGPCVDEITGPTVGGTHTHAGPGDQGVCTDRVSGQTACPGRFFVSVSFVFFVSSSILPFIRERVLGSWVGVLVLCEVSGVVPSRRPTRTPNNKGCEEYS